MRLIAILALLLPLQAIAAVTVTASTVISLYKGSSKVGDYGSWDLCQAQALKLAQASTATSGTVTYTCKTEVRKIVAVYSQGPL